MGSTRHAREKEEQEEEWPEQRGGTEWVEWVNAAAGLSLCAPAHSLARARAGIRRAAMAGAWPALVSRWGARGQLSPPTGRLGWSAGGHWLWHWLARLAQLCVYVRACVRACECPPASAIRNLRPAKVLIVFPPPPTPPSPLHVRPPIDQVPPSCRPRPTRVPLLCHSRPPPSLSDRSIAAPPDQAASGATTQPYDGAHPTDPDHLLPQPPTLRDCEPAVPCVAPYDPLLHR